MKIMLAILLAVSVVSVSVGATCKYKCKPDTNITEVTNVTNEYYLDDSSISEAIAQAATLETLMPTAPGKTRFNVLGATYDGEHAIGFTAIHRFQEGRTLEAGFSPIGGHALVRVGMGFEF